MIVDGTAHASFRGGPLGVQLDPKNDHAMGPKNDFARIVAAEGDTVNSRILGAHLCGPTESNNPNRTETGQDSLRLSDSE